MQPMRITPRTYAELAQPVGRKAGGQLSDRERAASLRDKPISRKAEIRGGKKPRFLKLPFDPWILRCLRPLLVFLL